MVVLNHLAAMATHQKDIGGGHRSQNPRTGVVCSMHYTVYYATPHPRVVNSILSTISKTWKFK